MFSDYIVYADESGDHSLKSIDKDYPVFALVFVIFKKTDYLETVKKFKEFKFKYFGYDTVILHEIDIKREKVVFKTLRPKEKKLRFLEDLAVLIKNTNFKIITTIIDKRKIKSNANPYHISLLHQIKTFNNLINNNKLTHTIIEARGHKKDNELKKEFNNYAKNLPFELLITHKQVNSVVCN